MVSVDLKSLIGRLNDTCRKALEAAAGLCLARTNYNLEIEHWLLKLLDTPNTDLSAILRHYEVDETQLQRHLTSAIDKLKTGNARPPVLSPDTVDLARDAWLVASVEFGEPYTRSGHLLCSLLADESRARLARDASAQFGKISAETLLKELPTITANSSENEAVPTSRGAPAVGGAPGETLARRPGGKTPALDQYTIDLTAQARAGKLDAVLGRDAEVRQIVDILMRRRQNNPILTGEAGVGKTAVVEGFARRIVEGEVPPPLRGVALRVLDLGLLQAGASVRGEFENRLRGVIDEVKASPQPIILFIDEAHTLVGAGGAAGQGDAANLLKPALARGELRTIAATTWAEYKKYFEKDPALTRRFQVVKIEEPTDTVAVEMMRSTIKPLEAHHGVRVLDDAVVESVRLSRRYIAGRYLPDKCVSLLDTACARVATARNDVPPAVEDLRRHIAQLTTQQEVLERALAVGESTPADIDKVKQTLEKTQGELARLEERWKKETELVGRLSDIRIQLETGRTLPPAPAAHKPEPEKTASDVKKPAKDAEKAASTKTPAPATAKEKPQGTPLTDEQRAALKADFHKTSEQLAEIQGEHPLLTPWVDKHTVAAVVAAWTGIPIGRMVSDEINTVLNLKTKLEERIVGQSHALDTIAQSIRTARADLTDPVKPIGVFFMPGPSGVGKTETALALAELLYGGEQNMTVINMSEFKEEHKVSLLMGSPPGYVGYGEGGVLTEAVRRKPYSVVLLDEMEKAHPGVQDIFYQVFDKGMLRDGEGRDIYFRNCVIIMTSNAASDVIMKLCTDPDTRPTADALASAIHPELLKTFKPAFLGRCTITPYFPLSDDVMRNITRLKLDKIVRRVRQNYNAEMTYTPDMVDAIVKRCTEVESGARNIDNIVSRTLLPELSAEFLARMASGTPIRKVEISMAADGRFAYALADGAAK